MWVSIQWVLLKTGSLDNAILFFSLSKQIMVYEPLYNNQINARALIGQSAVGYCYYKPTEKSRVFWIII